MKARHVAMGVVLTAYAFQASGQIRVSPTGANVNTTGATVVFLTFGGLNGKIPVEAFWCGDLIDAAPDLGRKCNPETIFGSLPIRYDLSQVRNGSFTDIMSIPPSVARRAYQDAERGAVSTFFYVRRFVDPAGGPDEYVPVICHMSGGGARSPFALLDVQLRTENDAPTLSVLKGRILPKFSAEVAYTGSGTLRGRWEIVLPGEEGPSSRDLLTEATLPVEERLLQKRYSEIERFSVFLPPTGKYVLSGPDPRRFPTAAEGLYQVLLRIEATDDKEGDSDLGAVGAGSGVVHSGAVAGFPMPVLRYYVGSGDGGGEGSLSEITLLHPGDGAVIAAGSPVDLAWAAGAGSIAYRVEITSEGDRRILDALLPAGTAEYRLPSWIREKAGDGRLRWRIVGVDSDGEERAASDWRTLFLAK